MPLNACSMINVLKGATMMTSSKQQNERASCGPACLQKDSWTLFCLVSKDKPVLQPSKAAKLQPCCQQVV